MKVLCSQEVVSLHLWGSSHVRALRRRLHPRHPGVCPGAWLHKGEQEEMAWSKAVDFYALSWGVPRKPAYNLAETAQRKSQNTEPHFNLIHPGGMFGGIVEHNAMRGIGKKGSTCGHGLENTVLLLLAEISRDPIVLGDKTY